MVEQVPGDPLQSPKEMPRLRLALNDDADQTLTLDYFCYLTAVAYDNV